MFESSRYKGTSVFNTKKSFTRPYIWWLDFNGFTHYRWDYSNITVNPCLLSLVMYLLHSLEPHKVVLWKETNMEKGYSVLIWFFEIMVQQFGLICLAGVIMKLTGSILSYRTGSWIFLSPISGFGSLLCGFDGLSGLVSWLKGSEVLIRYLWKSHGQ